MPGYEFVLLDADGTLFDFERAEDAALDATLAPNGLPGGSEAKALYSAINQRLWERFELGEITKAELLARRFAEFLQAVGGAGDPIALNAQYLDNLGRGAYLLEGAEALCCRLSKAARLFIVTNGVSAVQYSRMALCPIRDCFEAVFVSEDTGFQKPQRGYFAYVFARIPGFDPQAAIIVGDSLTSDIQGGINAGIDNCWYNPRGLENPRGIPYTYQIRRLDELDAIVLGRGSAASE